MRRRNLKIMVIFEMKCGVSTELRSKKKIVAKLNANFDSAFLV